jgi:hypothetical protein
MTDPYRDATGTPCLRCELPLVADEDKDLVCPDVCGRWISATTLVKLLGTTNLPKLRRPIAHWKATPFAVASCPTCHQKLVEQYMPLPDGDILSHGFCPDHGAWLDHASRAEFTAAYKHAIDAQARGTPLHTDVLTAEERALRDEANRFQAGEQAAETLEQRVERLERQVAELRDFVGRRKWGDWKE